MVLGLTPALKIRIFGGLRRLATASAIWLKQALSSHRKRMFLSRIALLIVPPRSYLAVLIFALSTERLTLNTSCISSPFLCAHWTWSFNATVLEPAMIKLRDLFMAQLSVLTLWSCL